VPPSQADRLGPSSHALSSCSLVRFASGFVVVPRRGDEAPLPTCWFGSFYWASLDNDPSAYSPTKTLVRLILPLSGKVKWTSRDVASSKSPMSSGTENFTRPLNR